MSKRFSMTSFAILSSDLALAKAGSSEDLLGFCGLNFYPDGINQVHVKTCQQIKASVPGYAINSVKYNKSRIKYPVSIRRWGPFTVAWGTMPPDLSIGNIDSQMVMKTAPEGDDKASSSIFSKSKMERIATSRRRGQDSLSILGQRQGKIALQEISQNSLNSCFYISTKNDPKY